MTISWDRKTKMAASAFFLLVAGCDQKKSESANDSKQVVSNPTAPLVQKLGCDDQVCIEWSNIKRKTIFKTTVGNYEELTGVKYKILRGSEQRSQPEDFHVSVLCSKSLPAAAFMDGGKLIVHWLSPDNPEGSFGYNNGDYPDYLAACHSTYGKDLNSLAAKIGYSIDPKFVEQQEFPSVRAFGESLEGEAEKRNATASLIGSCEITVKGHSYTNGPCNISIAPSALGKTIVLTDILNDYFAYINGSTDSESRADGTWNGTEKSSHADDSLGVLTVNADCWENSGAKLCYHWL